MEKTTQTPETFKDIYDKLEIIQSVLGFILEKTNLSPEPPVINVPPYNPLHHFPAEPDEKLLKETNILILENEQSEQNGENTRNPI